MSFSFHQLFVSTVNFRSSGKGRKKERKKRREEKRSIPPDAADSRVSASLAAAARDQPEIRYSMRKLEGDDFARWKSFSH